MKKIILWSGLTLIMVAACNTYEKEQKIENEIESLLAFTKGDYQPDSQFFVSEEDVAKYVEFQQMAGQLSSVQRIFPINYYDNTTSYVIETEEGWEMISSDKRGPIVLAQGEGAYVEEELPKGTRAWIAKLNKDVAYRWAMNTPLNEKNEQEVLSYNYWTLIVNPKEIIEGQLNTKSNPGAPLGDYVLYSLESEYIRYDSIPHLTTSRWCQGYAYNYACPERTDPDVSSLGKALAGCTPVAGAQMLYYLHNTWGYPIYAPSYASCSGTASSPVFNIPDPNSSTIWTEMHDNSFSLTNKAYIIIADAGRRGGANYNHQYGTAMRLDSLITFFDAYGIDCSFSNYQTDTVKQSLLRHYPVPVRADGYAVDHEEGHSFLIDGYIRFAYRYTALYRWVYFNPTPGEPLPEVEDAIRISYSTPEIQLIMMNWGSSILGSNSGRYGLTGIWEDTDTSYYYSNGAKMLHNFRNQE